MSMFSGLAGIGLESFVDKKLYEEDSDQKTNINEKVEPQHREEEYLFEKKYICPVCDTQYKSLTVRAGKARLLSQDDDLRPRYEGVDPIKYDAILCNHCGFAAISKGFTNMTSMQRRNIREQVSAKFKPLPEVEGTLTYEDAILRHKIALICCIVKNAKSSERAFVCLKLAWLTRAKMEETDPNNWEYVALERSLKECYQNAYDGFVQAFSKETFPMMGMEEMTATYLLAVLAFKLEKYEDALKLAGHVITGHNVGPRLKEKTIDLKDKIKAVTNA